MTKKRLLATRVALVSTVILLVLLRILGIPGSNITPARSAPPDVRNSLIDSNDISAIASAGVSYTLDSMNDPRRDAAYNNFIGERGVWCEIDNTGSNATCTNTNPHLLSHSFDESPRHGDSGYGLRLTYDVTQPDALASYYEHLF